MAIKLLDCMGEQQMTELIDHVVASDLGAGIHVSVGASASPIHEAPTRPITSYGFGNP